ncbi:S8 family serine peptidase [Deinococcus sp.]|uniref:S8 family serine peptidase n=1 Tax=Deinococcus sp. TaxID=47478 RepID=UPI003CC54081
MKRLLRGLLAAVALSLMLVACPQPSQPDGGLQNGVLALGYDLSGTLQQPFAGSWMIEELPAWLTALPISGTGNLNSSVQVSRSAAVKTDAAQATLSGTLSLRWHSQDGSQTGVAQVAVTASLYHLSGQVVASGTAITASDLARRDGLRGQGTAAAPGAVIVTYRSEAARVQATRLEGSVTEDRVSSAVGRTLTLQTSDPQATIRRLRAQPEIESVVQGAVLTALDLAPPAPATSAPALSPQALSPQALAQPLIPTDEYAAAQWAFRLLGYPAVWRDMQQTPYTRPVTVAVLDTGVRYDHPDLKGQLYGPGDGALDVLSSSANGDGDGVDSDPTDPATPGRSDSSHGTHVSGIIAANWGQFAPPCAACSGSGVVGASYSAPLRVLPIRVLDAPGGNGSESDIAAAILYAAGKPGVVFGSRAYTNPHPAQVINLSLGGALTDSAQIAVLCDAVSEATRLGSLVVAAAGNFGGTRAVYPAACPGAVSVASVSLSDTPVPTHVYYSDAYDQVALSAPGGNPNTSYNGATLGGSPMPDEILSTGWNYTTNLPSYFLEAGTSQAAPQVTALAALLLSKGVAATPAAALERMVQTASDLGPAGRDPLYGAGLINPAAALGAAGVSASLGLSVQGGAGRIYLPALDALGRFSAYLPDGPFRLVAGQDSNGNGFAGEIGEPRAERSVTFGPALTGLNVGTLALKLSP